MGRLARRPESTDRRSVRLIQAGLLTAISIVLLVGPALGYLGGAWLDRRWSSDPWGTALGIILGLAASGRSTIQLIRQARDAQSDAHD